MAFVSEERLLALLMQYNPWWRDGRVPPKLVPLYRRLACSAAQKILLDADSRRFMILSGARQIGKTTMMYQLIDDLLQKGVPARNIVHLSFDNPLMKFGGFEGVLKAYDNAYPTDEKLYFFIDEVQYAENWANWMKVLYDSRRNLRLVATASALPASDGKTADGGVGRWVTLKIPTLSFYEYCNLLQLPICPPLPIEFKPTSLYTLNQCDLSDMMAKLSPLAQYFNRYLSSGGFPELALAKGDTYTQRLLREDIVDKVIKRDILALFKVRDPIQMEKVFLYLCMESSNIINFQTMSKALDGITMTTLRNYVEFLEQSNLIYSSNPMSVDGKAVLRSRPKIYIADAAIRNAVLMLDDVVINPEEMGMVVETAVYKHLVSFYYRSTSQVGYYRKGTGSQKEVDIVVQSPQGNVLCEVKYRERIQVSETDAIMSSSRKGNPVYDKSLIITKNPEDYGMSPHEAKVPVFRIPAAAFLYLLGHAEKSGNTAKL